MIEGCRQTVCLSSDMKLLITETSISLFVTARNEVGARLCFTRVCVSVHREGLCPSMYHRSHDQRGVSVHGGLCLGGSLPGGGGSVHGSLSRESLCPGGSLSGGSLSRGVSVRETPHTVMRGRYTSYWNAFLLVYYFVSHMQKQGYHPVLFNLL